VALRSPGASNMLGSVALLCPGLPCCVLLSQALMAPSSRTASAAVVDTCAFEVVFILKV